MMDHTIGAKLMQKMGQAGNGEWVE